MTKKCEICGKRLEVSQSTHCSDECLFKSIGKSKPFMPNPTDEKSSTN